MINANWMSFFLSSPVRYDSLSFVFRSHPFCDSGDTNGVAVMVAFVVGTRFMFGCFARRIVRIDPIDSKYFSSENGFEKSAGIEWAEQLAVLDEAGPVWLMPSSIFFDRFIGDVLRSPSSSSSSFLTSIGLLSPARFRSVRPSCLATPANRRKLYDGWLGSQSSSELDDAVVYWMARFLYLLLRISGGGFSKFLFDGCGLS